MIRSYSGCMELKTYQERLDYLKLFSKVADNRFQIERKIRQSFYGSDFWKYEIRPQIILRDLGLDLGCKDVKIIGTIYVHHIDPITEDDIIRRNPKIYDPELLISASFKSHQYIHYSTAISKPYEERFKNDTKLW